MDLIIDTCSDKLKVILNNGKFIFESEEESSKHLVHLLPEIEKVMLKASKKLSEVDTLCVVLGPGSFTGIRIGVSTIKAFAMVDTTKKIIGLNLFDLLCYSISKKIELKSSFYIVIKSTQTKFYIAECSNQGKVIDMKLLTADEIKDIVDVSKFPVFSYNQTFNFGDNVSSCIILQTLDYVSFIDEKKKNKEYISLQEVKPIYLALSQAEEELNKKQNNYNV